MSYQVLARKWRPQTFQEVIGQPHVLTALENGLTQNRVHHAYLFSGTRGVGKTTIARLLAKSLNCETGVTSTPCGQCANCQAVDQGRFVDLLEIDAASRTKVDDTRELLDNVQYKPAQGRYKVYLIDEVHMLSKHSFNALLKTLEEPPEYVKFLLATTDPQKLPITVLSRCLQFHLKAILPEQIEQQLAAILPQENATFEQPALTVIAKAADGSMRDALSLTDQALAFGAGHIEYNAVLKMLGTIDQSHLYYLLHFIASGNSLKVFEKIQEFVHLGADFSALHQELATLCHQIALAQLQLNANVVKKTAIQLLAERLTPEEVQLFYQIAIQGYKDYSYAPNGKIALEMTVMRLLAFKPANYIDIDEAMLGQANQVESIEPLNEVVNPVSNMPSQASSNINHSEVNNHLIQTPPENIEHSEIIQPVDIQQTKNIAQIETSIPEPVANDFVANNTEVNNVVANNTNAIEHKEEITTAETTQTNTASLESSNSRNMLRSHRLKREALKKTEAATEQVSNGIDQSAAATKKVMMANDSSIAVVDDKSVNTLPQATEVKAAQETLISNNVQNNVNNNDDSNGNNDAPVLRYAETPSANTRSLDSDLGNDNPISNQSLSNKQELPPLTSYQDQQPTADTYGSFDDHEHVMNHDNFSANENVIIQSEPVVSHETLPAQVNSNTPQNADYLPYANKKTEEAIEKTKVNADISTIHHLEHVQTDVVLVENNALQITEVDISNYVESKMTDPWFLAIQDMQLVGFEKLLAKNTVMQKEENNIVLTLHEPQQHLINNMSLCDALKVKLSGYYGQEYSINIQVGKVNNGHTPIELESIVYQQYLVQAKSSVKNDPIVQTFVRDYAAKVYENSVVPL